jgi:hypothetical protein
MSSTPGLAIMDWWVRQAALRLAVIKAARAYAGITHSNLRGEAYRRRVEARDALSDAIEALDDAEAEWLATSTEEPRA